MRVALYVVGVAVAAAVGFAALFNMGWISAAALTAAVLAIVIVVASAAPDRQVGRLIAVGAGIVLVVGGVVLWGWAAINGALGGVEGPADAAPAEALSAAAQRLAEQSTFEGVLVQWTEAEFGAAVQASLDAGADNPFSSLRFDARPPSDPLLAGTLRITGEFKASDHTFSAVARPTVIDGAVHWDLSDVAIGPVRFPAFATGRLEEVVDRSVDVVAAMAPLSVEIQAVRLFDDAVIVVGIQPDVAIDPVPLVDAAEAAAGSLDSVINAPDPEYPAGERTAQVDGSPYYVAIGDSLAAGAGLGTPGEGYVARLHGALRDRTGTDLGLRNFAVANESSTSILGDQLTQSLEFMQSNDVAFVTIDVGLFDLVGHLVSDDCVADLLGPACSQRMDSTWVRYLANMDVLFQEVQAAAPDAVIVFLTTPNPFSLGVQSAWPDEAVLSRIVIGFNNLAAERALERGILVADGLGAINARALVATYVAGEPPSVLLNARGHGYVTEEIVAALEVGGAL